MLNMKRQDLFVFGLPPEDVTISRPHRFCINSLFHHHSPSASPPPPQSCALAPNFRRGCSRGIHPPRGGMPRSAVVVEMILMVNHHHASRRKAPLISACP